MAGPGRALVTGAAAGLGLAICKRLADAGWQIVALDRDREGLEDLERTFGGCIRGVCCDLADLTAIEDIEPVLTGLGPFRLVVLCAGISATGHFATIPADRQHAVMTVNLIAPIAMTDFLIRGDAVEPGGCLVFISSLSRYLGYPGAAAYAASKEGLAVFARSVRRPLSRSGIKVLTVCPGPLDTGHAVEHGPPASDTRWRLNPNAAAAEILAATRRPGLTGLFLGGNVCVPGFLPKILAFTGMLLPALATRAMRRFVFMKL